MEKNQSSKFFSVLTTLLATTTSLAATPSIQYAVNMQDGGLILKESIVQGLDLQRTYRSRSIDRGYFGMGWCSDFESHVKFEAKGMLRLESCQFSRPQIFKLSPSAARYTNLSDSQDMILIKMGYYERRLKGQWQNRYDFKGRLVEFRKDKASYKISYNVRGLPDRITRGSQALQLSWDPLLDLITQMKWNHKKYKNKYTGFDLTQAQTMDGILLYQYDDLDNLTSRKASNSHETSLSLSYDREEDRVLSIHARCQERYRYSGNLQRLVASVIRTCEDKATRTQFIFNKKKGISPSEQIHVTQTVLTPFERLSLNQGVEQ